LNAGIRKDFFLWKKQAKCHQKEKIIVGIETRERNLKRLLVDVIIETKVYIKIVKKIK